MSKVTGDMFLFFRIRGWEPWVCYDTTDMLLCSSGIWGPFMMEPCIVSFWLRQPGADIRPVGHSARKNNESDAAA
jgi:hypothetical protein